MVTPRVVPAPATASAPELILGTMRIADLDDAAVRDLLAAAADAGIGTVDFADIYGGAPHRAEERFAASGAVPPGQRDRWFYQSKAGIRPGVYDSSHRHLVTAVEGSLRALGTDHLDLWLLHRPDALGEPEEIARAVDDLHAAGKIGGVGVSNHTAGQIALLSHHLSVPISTHQVQLSLLHADPILAGLGANTAAGSFSSSGAGIIEQAQLEGFGLQAWSPFQGPHGVFLADADHHPAVVAELDRLAETHGVGADAIAAAWILRHPASWQVVLGSTRPARITSAAEAKDIALSRDDWYALYRAAGHPLP